MDDTHLLDEIAEVLDYSHKYNGYVAALCPFHDDHRPSFFVYPDNYVCLSCGAHGKSYKLLEQLKPGRNIFTPVKTERHSYNPWTRWLKDTELERVLVVAMQNSPSYYLETRGIDKDTQKKLEIGMLDDWITFPIRDEGGWFIGGVARAGETNTSKSKYIIPAGQDINMLYVPSWKRISTRDFVIVTFGILDAVTLYMLGYASISSTTGKMIHHSAFGGIRKRLIIVPDMYEHGEANSLASKLGWRGGILRITFPLGAKDFNDMIWKLGMSNDEVKKFIDELV